MESIPHSRGKLWSPSPIPWENYGVHPPFHGFHLEFLESTPPSMDSIWIIPGRVKYRLHGLTLWSKHHIISVFTSCNPDQASCFGTFVLIYYLSIGTKSLLTGHRYSLSKTADIAPEMALRDIIHNDTKHTNQQTHQCVYQWLLHSTGSVLNDCGEKGWLGLKSSIPQLLGMG